MADLVVGRSEGVAYPNNNLTYGQFKQEDTYHLKKWCTCNKEETCIGCLIDKVILKEFGTEGLKHLDRFRLL